MTTRHRVVRRMGSLGPDLLAPIRRGGVATTHEALGRSGLLDPEIRPIQSGASVAGSAVTVLTEPDDNLMIHAAVERCGPGDILVVGVTAASRHGLVGELLATALKARGVVGLVIDAGVRDTAALREMGLPVWARLVSAQGATKQRAGSVNVPITCGGQPVSPGDAIVADDDGVVCVNRAVLPEVSALVSARMTSEDEKRVLFVGGTLSLDLYGLRDTLRELGVETPGPDGDDA